MEKIFENVFEITIGGDYKNLIVSNLTLYSNNFTSDIYRK